MIEKKSEFKRICRIGSIVAAIVTVGGFIAAVVDAVEQKYTFAQIKAENYKLFFKRMLDFICASAALIVFSPLYLLLTITGAIAMKGNPFFVQKRPGWHERIFSLIKFRSMSNKKDADGNLLPDEQRLGAYGKVIRSFSLDELPEAINILKGDMSVVGPRPLLPEYLPYYTKKERCRHDVRPGLTGYAQIHGRNMILWEECFGMDIWYANNISLKTDIQVILDTVKAVLHHDGIALNAREDFDEYRKNYNTKTESALPE